MALPVVRIGLMSDLHLEFEHAYWDRVAAIARTFDEPRMNRALALQQALHAEPGHPQLGPDLRALKAERPDLLMLPGDIDIGMRGIDYADAVARYLEAPVIYVCGNHEAYRHDLAQLVPALRRRAAETDGRVIFLEQERADFQIRGCRLAVLGATLWTDYRLIGDQVAAMGRAARALNDHNLIAYDGRRCMPQDELALHEATRTWLAEAIPAARRDSDRVVVATHHGPLPDANAEEYRGDPLSPAFTSDLRPEIDRWAPDLWVWGHTHFSTETTLGRTRLVSAQRGYLGSEPGAADFVPILIEL